MKAETRIKAHPGLLQDARPNRQKHPIEQFHGPRRRAIAHLLGGTGLAMADAAAELGVVPLQARPVEPPGHLPALAALVAGHPHQIEIAEGRLQLGSQGLGAQVHIVVAEDQQGLRWCGSDRGVVGNGQGIAIGMGKHRQQGLMLGLLQRSAQQGAVVEGSRLQARSRHQMDGGHAHGEAGYG